MQGEKYTDRYPGRSIAGTDGAAQAPGVASKRRNGVSKEALGARIREARDRAGISQVDLARAVGVEGHTMWRYESGKTSAERKVAQIAAQLGVEPMWLLHGGEVVESADHVALATFLERIAPTIAPPVTDDEIRMLRGMRFHRPEPTAYHHVLLITRRGMSAEDAEESERVTSEAAERGRALGVKPRRG